jgi:hypothetical protein
VIFFLTAVTYAGRRHASRAGGSSSFTRHAFNELVSFPGWADAEVHGEDRDLVDLRAPLP